MPDELDVPADSSPAPAAPSPSPESGPAPVSAVPGFPQDRPVENVMAEWNRKFQALQDQLGQMMTYLARPAPTAESSSSYTDDQLYDLAVAGNKGAMQTLDQRREARLRESLIQQTAQSNALLMELQGVVERYPCLRDATHPLTQAATAYKMRLLAAGAQDTAVTVLEAIRQTIVNNPDLVPRSSADLGETQRRVGAQAAATIDAGGRRPAAPAPVKPKEHVLSPRELEIAQRMGVKDPQKAFANFEKRQADKRSSVSPLVAQIVREA